MKLIRLEIQNLASLDKEGGEVIDFESGQLGETSIFSIVGPTGSGKSTLLDAICLALYNRAPRYPRKKNDRNQGIEIYGAVSDEESKRLPPTDGRNILTRGKKKGYSKLVFLANNGNLYRAEWHVAFNRVKHAEPVCKLFMLTQNNGTQEESVCEWGKLPDIIGLDYDQFLRTVLIAQGSFANFLTANENERYLLLEKLVGCEETYSRIATEIKQRTSDAERSLDKLSDSLELCMKDHLDEEQLAKLKEEISLLNDAEEKLAQEIKTVEEAMKWYEEDKKLSDEQALCIKAEEQSRAALDAVREACERLQLHDAIDPATDIRRDIRRLTMEIAKCREEIRKITDKIYETNDKIVIRTKEREELDSKVKLTDEHLAKAMPHINKARLLREQVKSAQGEEKTRKATLQQTEEAMKSAIGAVKDNQDHIKKAEQKLKNVQEKQKQLEKSVEEKKEKLAKAEAEIVVQLKTEQKKIAGQNANELQQDKDKASDNLSDLLKAIEVVGNLEATRAEMEQNLERQRQLNLENQQLKAELEQLDTETIAREIETDQKTYTLLTSENWQLHRTGLESGKPCPLCGSTHHPFATDHGLYIEVEKELKERLEQKKEKLGDMRDKQRKLNGKHQENQGQLNVLQTNIRKNGQQLQEQEANWANLYQRHPDWSMDKVRLTAMADDFTLQKENTEKALTQYNKVKEEIEKLDREKDKLTEARNRYEIASNSQLKEARQAVSTAENNLTHHKAQTTNLLHQQNEKTEAREKADNEHKLAVQELVRLRQAFQEESGGEDPDLKEKRLQEAKKQAEQSVLDKSEQLNQLKGELSKLQGELETQEKLGMEDEEQLKAKDRELTEWMTIYNENAEKPLTTEMIDAMLDARDDWDAIRADKQLKEQHLTSARTLRENIENKVEEHRKKQPQKTLEELQETLEELKGKTRQQHLMDSRIRLQKHNEAERMMEDQKDELTRAQQDAADWTAINKAIGGDGKTLRKIAQCYTLRFLIEHANDEIRKFNSRYELQQVRNSLGIRVIDHDRADDIRDTTSLSGGETFIVSLGLALGLSSLSSRNISFDNLFIDEGFGTLDPDTLSTVIDSLAMLQTSQGKKVGVISHTDTMSERITTQICVIKNGNSGSSHIKIQRV